MKNRTAALWGGNFGLLAAVAHTFVHSLFVDGLSGLLTVGAIQANFGIVLGFVLMSVAFNEAVHRFNGLKLFAAGVGAWFIPSFFHDGTHLFYLPLAETFAFNLHGVPESGMTMAVIAVGNLLAIYYGHQE